MRSNTCKIEKGFKDLGLILKECDKVAVYNELSHKQALQLRLLCEDIDGMLPKIIDDFEGIFWIDFENGECKINISIEFAKFTATKKKELLKLSKNKKNVSVNGLFSKIGAAIEEFFLDEENAKAMGLIVDCRQDLAAEGYLDYSYYWSLGQYKEVATKTKKEEWDEIEKSVILSIADDVIVGVKGTKADITIIKNFAQNK